MEPTTEDRSLIVLAARGSGEAFGVLYDRHVGAVTTVVRRLLGDDAEVHDLVHDVFLEAWQRAGDFDPARGSVRAWLLVRARSRCLDRRKSPARTRRQGLESEPADETSPPDRLASRIDSQRMREALERLPNEQREAILLGYGEGLSSSEIAERLSVPIGTVKSRVHAGMTKLRAELDDPIADVNRIPGHRR